jgi:hypothetical protein
MNHRYLPLILGFIFLLYGSAYGKERSQSKEQVIYPFSGVLQDENLNMISGVYPLRFALYKSAKSRRAIWNERVWVGVDGGRYTIRLGARKALPRNLKPEKMFVGVSLEGVGEILREPLLETSLVVPARTETGRPSSKDVVVTGKGRKNSDIADRAMHAYEADHASNSDRLGNLTVTDLKTMFAPGKVKTGSRTKETDAAGGPGGKLYALECPRGYVVTGVQGGSGKYLDSISLICSPLELD